MRFTSMQKVRPTEQARTRSSAGPKKNDFPFDISAEISALSGRNQPFPRGKTAPSPAAIHSHISLSGACRRTRPPPPPTVSTIGSTGRPVPAQLARLIDLYSFPPISNRLKFFSIESYAAERPPSAVGRKALQAPWISHFRTFPKRAPARRAIPAHIPAHGSHRRFTGIGHENISSSAIPAASQPGSSMRIPASKFTRRSTAGPPCFRAFGRASPVRPPEYNAPRHAPASTAFVRLFVYHLL